MTAKRLLIANRGEIAIRIIRAARHLGWQTVAIYSEDDASSLHVHEANQSVPLKGKGARAYLDGAQVLKLARETECDAIHPGYGFLSENADFAEACINAKKPIAFIGPRPDMLSLFGDKAGARALAANQDVPLMPGTQGPTDLAQAKDFFASLGEGGAMVIKAIAGGGGRGMRAVTSADDIEQAFTRCQSEALQGFGNDTVYVEAMLLRARHIEVQVIGDGTGAVTHLGTRECTLQRRHQKLVEIAPAPHLPEGLRDRLTSAAIKMARAVSYDNLGTFEFLVDATDVSDSSDFAFIETNARLQVEHTITEEVTSIDLVVAQLQLSQGKTLADLNLEQKDIPEPNGYSIEARINMETMSADGMTKPSGGTLETFQPPIGPGIRVDTFGYQGYQTNPAFDSLLAKLIVTSPTKNLADAAALATRALQEFKIEGLATNIPFLVNLIAHPDFLSGQTYTRFVDDHTAELVGSNGDAATTRQSHAGAQIDKNDPLAVLAHGKSETASPSQAQIQDAPVVTRHATGPDGTIAMTAPIQGTIVSIEVAPGDVVHQGSQILIMEAMKMEHVISADVSGIVRQIGVAEGDTIFEDHPLVFIEPTDVDSPEAAETQEIDLDYIRPDLEEVLDRHARGLDQLRPEAVARRRKTGQRTVRENITDLCDEGTFVEYGPLVIAAQRRRRELDDLIKNTPADGLVAGIGRVNSDKFEGRAAQVIAMSYDYTVLAGTQGKENHRKKDRLFEVAEKSRLPVIFFTEGGGGRPGDTDAIGVAGLDCLAFAYFGALSGLVPLVGINSGRCFAGNAALLGCCDVVIATENSTIGMGGPAMIEGGNLGIFKPEEVGPVSVQAPNGVIDILVKDEEEAVAKAKKYISYFQGSIADWHCADQRELRHAIPENRLRIYDVRQVIETLADTGSVLELRQQFALGMVTSFIRVEGKPVGVIANNPSYLAGAIDSDGADKAARFMGLCDAFDIPILFLCDTPGIMVGPEIEKTALVRHAARMFVTGASLTVPFFTIVLRKGYGLGAQAMAGGSFHGTNFTIAWPTSEFGGMGLEGAVKLGFRKELLAIEDPAERKVTFDEMVARAYERGKGVNMASHFEIDDVIDPQDSRHWITSALKSAPPPTPRAGKKRPMVDTW